MRITIEALMESLAAFQPLSGKPAGIDGFANVRLAQSCDAQPDTLFIGLPDQFDPRYTESGCGYLSVGRIDPGLPHTIVLPDGCDPYTVFTQVQAIFDSLAACEIALLRASPGGSYQEILDIGFKYIGNPLFFLDSSYRVFALTPREMIPDDTEWGYMVEYGFSSLDTVKALRDTGEFDLASTFETATMYHSSVFKATPALSNLRIDGVFCGRVVALPKYKELGQVDVLKVDLLSEALRAKMALDDTFRRVRAKDYLGSLLRDLLFGVHLNKRLISERLQHLPSWTGGCFRVIVIPLGSSDDQTFDFYAHYLEGCADSCSILLDHSMVAVLHFNDPDDFSAAYVRIVELLLDNGLIGGVSNEFTRLENLHDYYLQATFCLEAGGSSRCVHLYSDYALDHVLSFTPPESRGLLCHPSVLHLMRHDAENGTQFAETLHAYLRNERSLVKTAAALYIHRNTLLYRLGKIESLVKVDLDDPRSRLHLLLSFEMQPESAP